MKTQEELKSELADLREKHGKVREFIVPIDEDDETKTATFFLRPTDRKTKSMVDKMANSSRERAVIAGLKAWWLGGDFVETITNNDFALDAAEAGLVKYMQPAEVIIKKN